jgi:hypothetical protein
MAESTGSGQQHGVDDAEHGAAHADAERYRADSLSMCIRLEGFRRMRNRRYPVPARTALPLSL